MLFAELITRNPFPSIVRSHTGRERADADAAHLAASDPATLTALPASQTLTSPGRKGQPWREKHCRSISTGSSSARSTESGDLKSPQLQPSGQYPGRSPRPLASLHYYERVCSTPVQSRVVKCQASSICSVHVVF